MSSSALTVWRSDEPIIIPKDVIDAGEIAPLAQQLRKADIDKVVKAFQAGLYELAMEFVWKRTMAILKRQLSMMGMSFVGEMLARPDISDDSPIELAVTDFEAISLAHQLGVVNKLGALELRQYAELLTYYSGPDIEDGDELPLIQAISMLRGCVVHILARNKIEAALDFSALRKTLTQQVLQETDATVINLKTSPYFFKRTTVRVLLADAKTEKGAQSENALGNLNVLLPLLWADLQDPDRWQVGQTYAETNANNLKRVSATLRRTLMTVKGFDYVPETLRSGTYTKLANEVLRVHEQLNNYNNEPVPMKALSMLGSTVPGPAFQICMRATLAVKLGNRYGHSFAAQEFADKVLNSMSPDGWSVYLTRFLPSDELIILKLTQDKPAQRWRQLVSSHNLATLPVSEPLIERLLLDAARNNRIGVKRSATALYDAMG